VQAILTADLILVGPGSLYTSILPDLLVPDIAEAMRISRALKFYICNVATQPGETDGFSCYEHVKVIEKHIGGGLFDLILCNDRCDGELPEGIQWVQSSEDLQNEYPIYCTELVDAQHVWRHSPEKLAQAIMELYYEKTGPLAVRDGGNNSEN
jgi:uncharacterized cofD-like protein